MVSPPPHPTQHLLASTCHQDWPPPPKERGHPRTYPPPSPGLCKQALETSHSSLSSICLQPVDNPIRAPKVKLRFPGGGPADSPKRQTGRGGDGEEAQGKPSADQVARGKGLRELAKSPQGQGLEEEVRECETEAGVSAYYETDTLAFGGGAGEGEAAPSPKPVTDRC